MIDISFLGEESQQDNILDAMVRAPNAGHVFGRASGFADREQARAHLSRWLEGSHHDHLAKLTTGPLAAVIDHHGRHPRDETPIDERLLGDIVTDEVTVHVLRGMGVDPRSLLVALAFHPYDEIVLDGIMITPSRIDQMALGIMTLNCGFELDASMDVSTDRRRIEVQATLPDTVVATVEGRPVRDIVSHPLVDGLDITVLSLHETGSGLRLEYAGGDDVRLADIDMHTGEER